MDLYRTLCKQFGEDITQEVMLRLHKQTNEIKNIEHWCRRVARNLCIDAARKRKISPVDQAVGLDEVFSLIQQAPMQERQAIARQLLSRIRPQKLKHILGLGITLLMAGSLILGAPGPAQGQLPGPRVPPEWPNPSLWCQFYWLEEGGPGAASPLDAYGWGPVFCDPWWDPVTHPIPLDWLRSLQAPPPQPFP